MRDAQEKSKSEVFRTRRGCRSAHVERVKWDSCCRAWGTWGDLRKTAPRSGAFILQRGEGVSAEIFENGAKSGLDSRQKGAEEPLSRGRGLTSSVPSSPSTGTVGGKGQEIGGKDPREK